MNRDKLDPPLQKELEHLREKGDSAQRLTVIVELVALAELPSSGPPDVQRGERFQQGSLASRLSALGVTKPVRPLSLVHAFEADLSPSQIAALSDFAEVKRITWSRAEKVTA